MVAYHLIMHYCIYILYFSQVLLLWKAYGALQL